MQVSKCLLFQWPPFQLCVPEEVIPSWADQHACWCLELRDFYVAVMYFGEVRDCYPCTFRLWLVIVGSSLSRCPGPLLTFIDVKITLIMVC